MYDTDFNREILASHYYLGHWRIVDEELDAIIRERADQMRAEIVEPTELEKSVQELSAEYRSADKKDQQKILDKMARLINENANNVLKPQTRIRKDPVSRKRSRIRIPLPKKPEKPIKAVIPEGEQKPKVDDPKAGEESKSTDMVKVDE